MENGGVTLITTFGMRVVAQVLRRAQRDACERRRRSRKGKGGSDRGGLLTAADALWWLPEALPVSAACARLSFMSYIRQAGRTRRSSLACSGSDTQLMRRRRSKK